MTGGRRQRLERRLLTAFLLVVVILIHVVGALVLLVRLFFSVFGRLGLFLLLPFAFAVCSAG